MTATRKQRRKATGLNRHELHHESHIKKSPAKIARAGWTREKNKGKRS